VPADQTQFTVSNPKAFSEKGFIDRRAKKTYPHDLVIVERNEDGSLNWSKCEYATIAKVDNKQKSITVQRGRYQSKALDYGQHGVYIAPIGGNVWGGNRLWFYNHASTCPRNADGKTASDVFMEEVLAKINNQSGDLKGFSGIAFDVMYWNARSKDMDLDLDGEADGVGIIDGKHVWREGMNDWLVKLRKAVGPDFILVSDSGLDKHQRAVGVLSGMESEGFPYHHDAFRGFSTPINHFAYWKEYGIQKQAFNFSAVKYKEKADLAKQDQYGRFAIGTMTCLDIFATRHIVSDVKETLPIDELTAGKKNQPQWLGKITGPLIRSEDSAPDLFKSGGTQFSKDFLSKVKVKGGSYTVEENGILRLQGNTKNADTPMTLTLSNIPRPQGDIVLTFEAKSVIPFSPELNGELYPRMVSVKVDGLPDYPEASRGGKFFNDLTGAFGTPGFTTQRFYFRDLDEGKGDTITLNLTFEGQGAVQLKSLQLLAGSQLMAREFENGIVLVNPSFDTKTFDLTKLFPNYKGKYRFINGRQAPNSGKPVADPTAVKVSPIDALMLEKD